MKSTDWSIIYTFDDKLLAVYEDKNLGGESLRQICWNFQHFSTGVKWLALLFVVLASVWIANISGPLGNNPWVLVVPPPLLMFVFAGMLYCARKRKRAFSKLAAFRHNVQSLGYELVDLRGMLLEDFSAKLFGELGSFRKPLYVIKPVLAGEISAETSNLESATSRYLAKTRWMLNFGFSSEEIDNLALKVPA